MNAPKFYSEAEIDIPLPEGVRVWTAIISGNRLRLGIKIYSDSGEDMAAVYREMLGLLGDSFLAAAEIDSVLATPHPGSEPPQTDSGGE